MHRSCSCVVALITIICLDGCGSGGGGGASSGSPAPATVLVKTYYDAPANTLLASEGLVLVGTDGKPTTIKNGLWKEYYPPADGNGLQSEMIFVKGVWDKLDFWTRYNPDCSIQDAMIDSVY